MSGDWGIATRPADRAAGFDAHLTKPVDFAKLRAPLCDVAERRPPR